MSLKSVIFGLLLIQVAKIYIVEGLQCYVCEDCNEYEDFKELHICGEIPVITTAKPSAILAEDGATVKPTVGATVKPTGKPSLRPTLSPNNEESVEVDDEVNVINSNTKTTKKPATTTNSTTTSKTTTKPTETLAAKPTTATEQNKTTTQSTSTVKEITKPATTTGVQATTTTTDKQTTTPSTVAVEAATTTTTTKKPNPVPASDYDDYLEYEDPVDDQRSARSLLKINEPVCYMIKYQVNNTVFTNRGCTTFINANKYLTCQSLYNGAPMESCRVCSSNGCNKYLSGDSEEDDHGLPINSAGVIENFGFVVLFFWVLINRYVI